MAVLCGILKALNMNFPFFPLGFRVSQSFELLAQETLIERVFKIPIHINLGNQPAGRRIIDNVLFGQLYVRTVF